MKFASTLLQSAAAASWRGTWFLLALGLSGGLSLAQPVPPAGTVIKPQPNGVLELDAAAAAIHGQTARLMTDAGCIGYWPDPADYLSWPVSFEAAGDFAVRAEIRVRCGVGGQQIRDQRWWRKPGGRIGGIPALGSTLRLSNWAR